MVFNSIVVPVFMLWLPKISGSSISTLLTVFYDHRLEMESRNQSQKLYYRKRLQDPGFRKKESERVNAYNKEKRLMMTEVDREEDRIKKREYMGLYRLKKKQGKIRIDFKGNNEFLGMSPKSAMRRKTGFGSKPALRKAVRKLLDKAPTSPSKRKGAIAALARDCGLVVNPSPREYKAVTSSLRGLSDDTVEKVRNFFFNQTWFILLRGKKMKWHIGRQE